MIIGLVTHNHATRDSAERSADTTGEDLATPLLILSIKWTAAAIATIV